MARGRSDTRVRALFASHPHALFVYDRKTLAVLDANDAALELYGYSRAEFLSLTIADIRPDEDRPRLHAYLASAGEGPTQAGIWRHRRRDGTIFEVEVSSHPYRHGGAPARLVTVVDISEQRRAEEAAAESERRFRELLRSVELIAVTLDARGRVTFANDFLLQITGLGHAELIGADWFELCVPAVERAAVRTSFVTKIAAGEIAARDENHIVTRRGDTRLIQWSNTTLRGPDGSVAGTASIGFDVTERRRIEERLVFDAFRDPVTGLPNRALFLDRLTGAIARAARRDDGYALLLLDLDGFKVVNESLGHGAGDELIREVSETLTAAVADGDTVARLGGDEFAILLEGINDVEAAANVARRIQAMMRVPHIVRDREVFMTASIGIAHASQDYGEAGEVLRDADAALNRAKERGRHRFEVFEPAMRRRAVSRLQLDSDLRRALDREELFLEYQPIVDLATRRPVAFEALVRWNHPLRGRLAPSEFVGFAEESGLIVPIGDWVLREACRQLVRWHDSAAAPHISVSVNMSTKQLADPQLAQRVDAALDEAGADPTKLRLEITESVLMDNPDAAVAVLQALRDRGLRLGIDDFGTGYSSLSYLVRFPIDTLKIDRAFVVGLARSDESREIAQAIVSLARNLRMDVVAEGIETEEQREVLAGMGCTWGQGYLFARPMSASASVALLGRSRPADGSEPPVALGPTSAER